jgi:hypothetical protein
VNAAFDEISTDEKVESADGRCFLIDKGIAYNADQWFKARSKKLVMGKITSCDMK